MTFHEILPTGGNDYKLVNKKTLFCKNIYPEEMAYFNKLNMKDKYDKLEKMKGQVMHG